MQRVNLNDVSLNCKQQSHLSEVQEQKELFLLCRAVFHQGTQLGEDIGALGTHKTELLRGKALLSHCLTSFLPPCSFPFGSDIGREAPPRCPHLGKLSGKCRFC